jgi:hypothetical protein
MGLLSPRSKQQWLAWGLMAVGLTGCNVDVKWSVKWTAKFDSQAIPVGQPKSASPKSAKPSTYRTLGEPNFLVLGGGGAPSYNEIAIEKNVLYFQRTAKQLGLNPQQAQIYFANGNDGKKTVRFIDPKTQREMFKAPSIPGVKGAATWANFARAINQTTKQSPKQPLFFYFTGHGSHNEKNEDNNSMILWNEQQVSVRQFTEMIDRLPAETPIVSVMVQCYAGAFANMIHEKGDPKLPVTLHTRCGFFATIKQLPSVGCTPEVDEADYEDYSSSFFAGLSGVDRVGRSVASADYNRDGRVGFNEAHAFAKVDEEAADLPISTSESWLRSQFSDTQKETILLQPIEQLMATARPEQKYVIETFAKRFKFKLKDSFAKNLDRDQYQIEKETQEHAYLTRLELELVNVGAEAIIRSSGNQEKIMILDRLLNCEFGSWQKPDMIAGNSTN